MTVLHAGADPAKATHGIVLLHGRGAGAQDIIGLGEALALPNLAFTAPEAANLSWWPTSFLAPTAQIDPYVSAGFQAVEHAVAAFEKSGIPRDRIGILGFSQGGCLALEYVARAGSGLGFGFGLSAGLVGTEDIDQIPRPELYGHFAKKLAYSADLTGTQIYTSCHEKDPHIPFARFSDSASVLQSLGATVTARAKPGQGHGIDAQDVSAVRGMLNTG